MRGGAQMIGTRFTYATTRVGFGSSFGTGSNSSYTNLKTQRARIGASLANTQATLNSITSAFATASQNNIDGLATLAAKAAIARVKADAKAKAAEVTKQIDSAQAALDSAKSATSTPGITVIGNTVIQKKYVSWALTPTVDTTA
jgi:hypothetical protein